jgi:hypothetical protein
MFLLARSGDATPPTQQALGEALGIDKSNVARLCGKMERQGHITQMPVADRRTRAPAGVDDARAASRAGARRSQPAALRACPCGRTSRARGTRCSQRSKRSTARSQPSEPTIETRSVSHESSRPSHCIAADAIRRLSVDAGAPGPSSTDRRERCTARRLPAADVRSLRRTEAQQALDAMDTRAPVPLIPRMAHHQKQNMRDHLVAVQEIVTAMATDDFAAIERAAGRIGFSEQMGQMCTHMGAGAPGFTDLALGFHHSADAIAAAARQGDRVAVTRALGSTLQTCTGCHAAFRQSVVDEASWDRVTSTPPPTGAWSVAAAGRVTLARPPRRASTAWSGSGPRRRAAA